MNILGYEIDPLILMAILFGVVLFLPNLKNIFFPPDDAKPKSNAERLYHWEKLAKACKEEEKDKKPCQELHDLLDKLRALLIQFPPESKEK